MNVDEIGLTPDVEIDIDIEAYRADKSDNQLERAKEEVIKLMR